MRTDPLWRRRLLTLLPALLALALGAGWAWWGAAPLQPSPSRWVLLTLVLIGGLAAVRSPRGWEGLSLGAMALPPVALFFGAAWAAVVAAAVVAARRLAGRLLLSSLPGSRDPSLLGLAGAAGRAALAALSGALVLQGLAAESGALLTVPLLAASSGAYLALLALLEGGERLREGERRGIVADLARGLAPELIGLLLGILSARVARAQGWGVTLPLTAALGLLCLEAARLEHRRRLALQRVRELQEVTLAGHRIIFQRPDLEGIAQQVLVECRRVLPFSWYQFDLLRGDESSTSWRAGADGLIEKGKAEPPARPPARPGIHRRTGWKVVERRLKADGEPLARLRLWVDPRDLETTSIELLDSLLPQVGSSVQRALLDHQAKRDPLTGLADRGVLESRLELAYLHCRSEGGSMAVIMCDLDLFKRINDRFGHDVGDRALVQVAGILEAHRREDDLCCRFGGEEFAVILERTDGETALRVAERLRVETRRSPFVVNDTRVPLGLSAGVAAYPELFVRSGKDLLILADEALLEAKRRGRNQALLHMGKGRFRCADGKTLEPESPGPEIEPPTLFA